MKTFQQFRDEISVIDMAMSVGFKYDRRKGKKWPIYVNDHKEKIMIVNPRTPSNQGYRNVHDDKDKGTLIDFIRNRLGKDFPIDISLSEATNINKALYNFTREVFPNDLLYKPDRKPAKPFTTEGLTSHLIYPYYLFSRGISREVLLSKEFDGSILNLANGFYMNIAFPYYNLDGRITAIEKKNYRYDFFVEGSELTDSVWHSNFPDVLDNMIIAESALDALSYHQIKQPENALYVAIGGSLSYGQIAVIKALKNHSKVSEDFRFTSAVDNDSAGELYNDKLKNWLAPEKMVIDKPKLKDFNKDLTETLKKTQKIKGRKV